jgi:hypothetical protein
VTTEHNGGDVPGTPSVPERVFWGISVLAFGFLAIALGLYGFIRVLVWDDPAHGFFELGLALAMSLFSALAARQL